MALSACTGGPDSDAAQSTVQILPTNYVTQPVVRASTTTIPGQTVPPGATTGGETIYVVEGGDALPLIASRFDITVAELADYNNWPEGPAHIIHPGQEIRIPPFAEVPEQEEEEEADDGEPETIPIPEPNGAPLCEDGTQRELYEVQSGDFQSRVADELDLTLAELEAANEGNPIWQTFIVGEDLWLPCEGESLGTTAESTE